VSSIVSRQLAALASALLADLENQLVATVVGHPDETVDFTSAVRADPVDLDAEETDSWGDVQAAFDRVEKAQTGDNKEAVIAALRFIDAAGRRSLQCASESRVAEGWAWLAQAHYWLGFLSGSGWGIAVHRDFQKSSNVQRLLDARHKESREAERMTREFYDAHRHEYKSDKAIRDHIAAKVVGLEPETVGRYITKHKKAHE
jgi:hypothetical protein